MDIAIDHCAGPVRGLCGRGVRWPCGEEAVTLEVSGFAPPEALVSHAVEVLDGDIVAHARRLVTDANTEVCVVAVTGLLWDLPEFAGRARWRVLVPLGAPPGVIPASEVAEVRAIDDPPLDTVIVDRSVALVRAVSPQTGDVTLRVHPGGLLQAVLALFERIWTAAADRPAPDRSASRPCPEDLQLLRLLVSGFTDDAIASRLEVGARTVQRRVHDLIDATGVRTRLQLIWHATRRGWI